ncbi:MAG: hypothetical protein H7175_02000, partial [Burkholderiales bacterium]|nr:hypothetical protein [Anaerolineae bacterium]
SDQVFDYVRWEAEALAVKVGETLWGRHPFMSEVDRSQYVRDYMALLAQTQALEGQIDRLYSDPATIDPTAASAELRAERDANRAELRSRQPLAESILEGQVAAVLVDQGFGVAGQLLPPMSMHFTQMPNLLIVSPRDRISFDIYINLNPMPVDMRAALEARVDALPNLSSLIVPLGGTAIYPAMILETASIEYAVEVIAHEWLHHYLYAFPLGYSYDFGGESRIINETTANLFGRELGPLVLARYYPELVPQPAPPSTPSAPSSAAPSPEPPAFDYGETMNETRVHVDELLAAGEVDEAEAYMEERRQLFTDNGYLIRKLNQAYFAFYGGYQSGAPGVGGRDPIGPAVHHLRETSPSIYEWILTMRDITTRDQLLAAQEAA